MPNSLDDLRTNVTVRTCIMLSRQIMQRMAVANDADGHLLARLLLNNLDMLDTPDIPDSGNIVRFSKGGR